jgi:hypothetical protein
VAAPNPQGIEHTPSKSVIIRFACVVDDALFQVFPSAHPLSKSPDALNGRYASAFTALCIVKLGAMDIPAILMLRQQVLRRPLVAVWRV